MNAYQHFGLKFAPFQSTPDPRFFYRSPLHEETLATLEYTVFASKACSVVVGDSGSGKSIIGRMICSTSGRHTTVLWIHGIGQPDHETEVSIFTPGSLSGATIQRAAHETTLGKWIRADRKTARPPLLIIDNADALPDHAWRDVLSLLTRDVAGVSATNVILLGMPVLLDLLASPELVRLRRRVFRTCFLPALRREHVREYVNHRVAIAGGDGGAVFTDAAIAHIHGLTRGLPALINQVCDNAMLEAYSREQTQIDGRDIIPAVQATVGSDPVESPLVEIPVMERRLPSVFGNGEPEPPRRRLPRPAENELMLAPQASSRLRRLTAPAGVRGADDDPKVDARLRQLESRLAHALAVVRRARTLRTGEEQALAPAGSNLRSVAAYTD